MGVSASGNKLTGAKVLSNTHMQAYFKHDVHNMPSFERGKFSDVCLINGEQSKTAGEGD